MGVINTFLKMTPSVSHTSTHILAAQLPTGWQALTYIPQTWQPYQCLKQHLFTYAIKAKTRKKMLQQHN